MSQENVERMRRGFAAFTRGDKETWSELFHPNIEVVPIGDWPEGPIRGREAVWDFFVSAEEPWERGAYELDEVTAGESQVAAHMRRELRGKASGVVVDYDYWIALTFRDGMVTRAEWFEDRQSALEAAGLSE